MAASMIRLLTNQTTSATGSTVPLKGPFNRDYRTYTVYATGTFDGATMKLQISMDGTNWVDVTSFTTGAAVLAEFNANFARGVVSTAGATTNLTLQMG